MSLTVPRGGTFAGRAPEIRIAAPDYGDTLAQFGDLVQQKAAQMQDAQRAITVRRAQIDMTRELGQARLEFEQMSDPEAIDRGWSPRAEEIRQRYTQGLDPEAQAALDVAWGGLNNQHMLDLGQKAIGLRQSEQGAEWINMRTQLTADAVAADEVSLEAFFQIGDQAIDARLANGGLTPEQAAQEKVNLRTDVHAGRASQLLASDPVALIAAADAGKLDALGGEKVVQYRVAAQSALDRRAAENAKAAELALKAQNTAVKTRLLDQSRLMSEGFTVVDEEFINSPEIAGNPDPEVQQARAAALAAQSLRDEQPGIRMMTVGELDAQIAAEMARPVAHQYQTERVKVLKTWRDEAATRGNTDFVGMMQEAGAPIVPELPAFDPANPDAFAQGLKLRVDFDDWAITKKYTGTQAVFSVAEKAALKPVLDPKADPTAKVALARSMLSATGGKPERLATVLEIDPVFARATRLLGWTGDAELAEEILRGQQKMASKAVLMPSDARRQLVFNSMTGGAFNANTPQWNEVFAAASALYAATSSGIQDEDAMMSNDEKELFKQSVQRVLGASPGRDGQQYGGLQEVNDAMTYLPLGISGGDVEQALSDLERHLQGNVRNEWMGAQNWGYPKDGSEPDRLRAFAAASVNPDTGVPDMARPHITPFLADHFATVRLERQDETGLYEMSYMKNGVKYVVAREDNRNLPFRFRLDDLMRGAAQ